MADPSSLLDTLHPLRAPPAPESVLPYMAAALVGIVAGLLLIGVAHMVLAHRWRLRRSAAAELALSRRLPPADRLAAQAKLLRRLARAMGRDADAHRHGSAWLETLDALFATSFFSQGAGRAFGPDLYSPHARPDVDGIDQSLSRLIAKVRQ